VTRSRDAQQGDLPETAVSAEVEPLNKGRACAILDSTTALPQACDAEAAMPKKKMIFCEYEQREFSEEGFLDDPSWGKVHNVTPRHTLGGTVIDDGGEGGRGRRGGGGSGGGGGGGARPRPVLRR
jgi:uncharacterized membrane protein YgcG